MRRPEEMPRAAFRTDPSAADTSSSSELLARLERYEARVQSGAEPRQQQSTLIDEGPRDEPVTPELALVDPALASRERERLSERPVAPIAAWRRPEPVAFEAPPVSMRDSTHRHRPRRRRVFWAFATVALAVATGLLITYAKSRNHEHVGSQSGQTVAPSTTIVPTTHAQGSTRARAATRTAKSKPKPKATPETKRQQHAPHRLPSKPPRASPSVTESGRTFAWVPVAEARYYLVEFYRGRREILRASPSAPRLILPSGWSFNGRRYTLAPGSYRWSVRPGFGPRTRHRYGKPIVQAKLVIQRTPGG